MNLYSYYQVSQTMKKEKEYTKIHHSGTYFLVMVVDMLRFKNVSNCYRTYHGNFEILWGNVIFSATY